MECWWTRVAKTGFVLDSIQSQQYLKPRYSNSFSFKYTCFMFRSKYHSTAFYLRQRMRFLISITLFFYRNWIPDRLKVSKVLSVQIYLDVLTHTSQKLQTTALRSFIKIWIDGFILLNKIWFLYWRIILFVPVSRDLVRRDCKKVQFAFSSFFKPKLL